jgi:pimeloyl-ACP methyl ester carboxylesterase
VKRLRLPVVLALGVLLGFFAGWLYPYLDRPPLLPGQDAVVAGVDPTRVKTTYRPELGGYLDIAPPGEFGTLLIFYPGGLVRPQAYEWLGVALAPYGVRTLIPVFPADLAVLTPNRAEQLLPLAAGKRVVLGGHSLGGAMAVRFAARHPGAVSGLVLMGAFGAEGDDLSALPLEVLVLAAEHDGLATLAEVRAGLARSPATAQLSVVRGGVHSFFGRYGPQRGDGRPTVTRAAAEAQIVRALADFVPRGFATP